MFLSTGELHGAQRPGAAGCPIAPIANFPYHLAGLGLCARCLHSAGETAKGTGSVLVAEVRRTFRIINQLGLHARAASALSKLASAFASEILIEKDGQTARSTSVIELLLLCGQPGSEITVVALGEDAPQAVQAIGALIADRFGESL